MKRDPIKRFPSQERIGTCWDIHVCCPTSMLVGARPNSSPSFAQRLERFEPKESSRLPMRSYIPGGNAELTQILKPIIQGELELDRPAEAERPPGARWRTWLWPHENDEGLPPLRVLLVWDNLAGHLSHELFPWLFGNGIMPLYTPLGGSWLKYWPSRCSASSCAAHSLGSIPSKRKRSSTGWSKRWLVGMRNPHRLSGVANASSAVSVPGYDDSVGQALLWSRATQSWRDPLVGQLLSPVRFKPPCGSSEPSEYGGERQKQSWPQTLPHDAVEHKLDPGVHTACRPK